MIQFTKELYVKYQLRDLIIFEKPEQNISNENHMPLKARFKIAYAVKTRTSRKTIEETSSSTQPVTVISSSNGPFQKQVQWDLDKTSSDITVLQYNSKDFQVRIPNSLVKTKSSQWDRNHRVLLHFQNQSE